MSRPRITAALTLALVATACASAGDRFEQGIEAEAYGRYYEAAMRYVEALEKDEDLVEARDRLMEAGDSAIVIGMRGAGERSSMQDAVGAGGEYIALDRLLGKAQSVGVRLPRPADFRDSRRSTFDAAIVQLMDMGFDASERGRWSDGRRAYQQIRGDFQPSTSQRRASLDEESRLLLGWAFDEEDDYRLRRAFGLAGEAMAVSGGAPQNVMDEATALRARTLEAGTRFVAIFPVDKAPALDGVGESDPALQLADILELEHWRKPPAFVAVADPVVLRQLTRRYAPPGTLLRPRRILEEVGADYGVLIEISLMTLSHRNIRQRVRTARTRGGGTVRFTLEEGTLRYEINAKVILVDQTGRQIGNFAVSETESGPFERGVYDGDPRELDLTRSQLMLFDPARQAQARAVIEDRLIAQLAEELAGHVFERVLRRIP